MSVLEPTTSPNMLNAPGSQGLGRRLIPWVMSLLIAVAIIAIPTVYYRSQYEKDVRFREVDPGRFYRSGTMTEEGLRDNIRLYGIKTVINLMDEDPDPKLKPNYWGKARKLESQVCEEEGAKFIFLTWEGGPNKDRGLLPTDVATSENRPWVIDDFLAICDQPENYPILIHCKAGLHRTGRLVAIYRMEYNHWSMPDAYRELRSNGYGKLCNLADPYVVEYIQQYKPGLRRVEPQAK